MGGKILYPDGKPCKCGCGQPAARGFLKNGYFSGWRKYAKGHAPRGAPEEARKKGLETRQRQMKEKYPIGSRRMSEKALGLFYWEVKVEHGKLWKLEHRHIMEQILGRALASSEIVHHKDGNGLNNTPDNLELMTSSAHMSLHNTGTKPECSCVCPTCGKNIRHFRKGQRKIRFSPEANSDSV
jgi:hypothetical protein